MKVFLSWSGDRSKAVAEELGAWLAQVIQAVEPWISSGIEKGARWQSEIADRLDEAKVGIVCLTSGNLSAPWILFEAGALSKTKGSYVCTFLLDVTPGDVEPPLGQFQHTLFTREEVLKLVRNINEYVQKSGDRSLTDQVLTKTFDTFWLQLRTQLTDIKNQPKPKTHPRPERELLEEMLEILRNQEQRERQEKELGQAMQLFTNLADVTVPTAVDRYLNVLMSSTEKKVRSQILNAPTGPLFEEEPSNAEPPKK